MTRTRFVVRRSPVHGRGVFANTELPGGERLIEYRGARISSAEAHTRYGDNRQLGATYLFAVNSLWLIDGNQFGNSSRFFNHSCDPNCQAVIWVDINGDERRDRVYLETLRPVRRGEELCFDYALELSGDVDASTRLAWVCRCGSAMCRGSLLAPPAAG